MSQNFLSAIRVIDEEDMVGQSEAQEVSGDGRHREIL
jgi:hypothetical protein